MDRETEGPPTSIIPPAESNFSQVIFTNVQKFYAPKTDVQCKFCREESFDCSPKDWIGIFKVGWKTTREYFTWISARTSVDNTVLFTAYYLPKDDDYYQFCYVDYNGEVRGASIPFQFCHNTPVDDDDILMVTTEIEMMKTNEENAELKKVVEKLTEESSVVQEKVTSLQNENQAQTKRIQDLEEDLLSSTEKAERLEIENTELTVQTKNHMDETERMNQIMQSLGMDLQMQRSQEEKLLSEMKEMERSIRDAQEDKKHFEKLQIHMKTLEEEKEKLESELKLYREKEQKFLSDRVELEKSLEKSVAEKQHFQGEGMAKQKLVQNMTYTVNQCKEETVKLKAELELQTSTLEREKKQKENLKQSLDKEVQKTQDLERNMEQKTEKLKYAEERMSSLYKQVDGLKAENDDKMKQMGVLHITIANLEGDVKRMRNEVKKTADLERNMEQKTEKLKYAEERMSSLYKQVDGLKAENDDKMKQMGVLHITIANLEGDVKRMRNERKMEAERTATELRTKLKSNEEKMHDLEMQLAQQQDVCREQGEEMFTLRSALELRETEYEDLRKNHRTQVDGLHNQLLGRGSTTSVSPNQGLFFGNPYGGNAPSFSGEFGSITSSTSRRPSSPLQCPICDQTFFEHQILQDHVTCHLDEDESRP